MSEQRKSDPSTRSLALHPQVPSNGVHRIRVEGPLGVSNVTSVSSDDQPTLVLDSPLAVEHRRLKIERELDEAIPALAVEESRLRVERKNRMWNVACWAVGLGGVTFCAGYLLAKLCGVR